MKTTSFFIATCSTSLTRALTVPPTSSIDNSTYTSPTVPVPPESRVECDGGQYGVALRVDSCINALTKIIPDIEPHIYVPHDARQGLYRLPFRYISEELDDAVCAIDLVLRDGTVGDVSNGLGIARAARTLLNECVLRGNARMGGQITRFSKLPPRHYGMHMQENTH
ncbi:MAG: hypothetical protein HETSPECPRED_001530 [Heterodermia speciosa]|uniref:Uncharacterized protein n=1 Tax=Heterodermia speciosa TaxID=116794 RepID=A0A8H3J206_9LECA|nr:MAG: hypothetical protein HETSPECPRED_001530 [Heterodermia speciosa]